MPMSPRHAPSSALAPLALTLSSNLSSKLGTGIGTANRSIHQCRTCALRFKIQEFEILRRRQYHQFSFQQLALQRQRQGQRQHISAHYPRKQLSFQCRRASTLASITAVNATRDVLPRYRELYAALERLKGRLDGGGSGRNYVNLSLLGLALRGLESRVPVTRVAVLGLQTTQQARLLTKLLLADPLGAEGEWEKELDNMEDGDRKALLLKYGEEFEPEQLASNALTTTLNVPSRVLQRHNLEILISTLNINSTTPAVGLEYDQLKKTALVPTAETPKSFGSAVSFVTFPVHRAIVLADGVDGCIAVGRFVSGQERIGEQSGTVQVAVNLPLSTSTSNSGSLGAKKNNTPVTTLDLAAGAEALVKIRQSHIEHASAYERGWFKSGLPALTSWMSSEGSVEMSKTSTHLNPALHDLISYLLADAQRAILVEDNALLLSRAGLVTNTAILDKVRQPLEDALKAWAVIAHTELQESLDSAFASRSWARLKWWKLLFRVDDVGMVAEELLERQWLVEAEKGLIWLSGRGVEKGVINEGSMFIVPSDLTSVKSPSSPPTETPDLAIQAATSTSSKTPYPTNLTSIRHFLSKTTIPPLQAQAQTFLVQSLSLTALSSALSTLLYISFPTASLYQVGAVAALGLAWSLRRLQKQWERTKESWEGDVREEGRTTLKDVEARFRDVLSNGGTRKDGEKSGEEVDEEGVQERRLAREVVARAKQALQDVVAGVGGGGGGDGSKEGSTGDSVK